MAKSTSSKSKVDNHCVRTLLHQLLDVLASHRLRMCSQSQTAKEQLILSIAACFSLTAVEGRVFLIPTRQICWAFCVVRHYADSHAPDKSYIGCELCASWSFSSHSPSCPSTLHSATAIKDFICKLNISLVQLNLKHRYFKSTTFCKLQGVNNEQCDLLSALMHLCSRYFVMCFVKVTLRAE